MHGPMNVKLKKQCSRVTGTGWEYDRKYILNNLKFFTVNYLIM